MNAAFDRAAHHRDDAEWLVAAAARVDARLVPIHGDRVLVSGGDVPRARRVPVAAARDAALTFLGSDAGAPVFAADLDDAAAAALEGADTGWDGLRRVLTLLPEADFELLAHARALMHWHRAHRHCGACGAPTTARRGGHERACAACGAVAYPRTDPCVIAIVGDAQRVLLGRQASWDAGRYSAIAGFVEPGETLEAAVAREVREETGIEVANPRYFGGQPWPFPASLMLGFHAEPAGGALALNDGELEDARWFTRAEIAAGLAAGTLKLSTRRSIAWRLIEAWHDRDGARLAGLPGA